MYLLKLLGLQFLENFNLGLQFVIFILKSGYFFSILLQHILLIEDLDVVAVLLLGVSVLVLLAQILGLFFYDLITNFKI